MENEEKIQKDINQQRKQKKKQEEVEYYNVLAMQAREREHKQKEEKDADKLFLQAENQKLDREENMRKRFFNKLKKIQNDNDAKQQRLVKYMAQDPAVLNSKKDETAYIRNIELGEKKALK